MSVFLQDSLWLWSLIAGAFLCAVYDLFRVFRLIRPMGQIRLFVADFLFCVISAVVMLVLFFNLTYGRVRLYVVLFALPGFLVWRLTVSRLFIALAFKVVRTAERLVAIVKESSKNLWKRFSKRIKTKIYCRAVVKRANHGFGIINRKEL